MLNQLDENLKNQSQPLSQTEVSQVTAKLGLVATMPRSGTWYNNLVYSFYVQLHMHPEKLSFPSGFMRATLSGLSWGVEWLGVTHMCCPGFDQVADIDRQAWDDLQFYSDGFDFGASVIPLDVQRRLNPAVNPKAKIIYCCRNPLDWAISAFMHGQQHVDERMRYYQDQQGQWQEFRDVIHFIRSRGLDSFIKQYLTFQIMKARYSQQIKFVCYEDLVRHPETFFVESLKFLGHDVERPGNREKIKIAIELSSQQNVKAMEQHLGCALAGDLKDPGQSHIRSGCVGQWKGVFGANDIQYVQARLDEFDISWDEFVFE